MRSWTTALVLLLAGSQAAAQNRWPVSLELNGGHGLGRTAGEYRDDGSGVAIDALVAYRLTPVSGDGVVIAVSSSGQGPVTVDQVCIPAPGGGCVPNFPTFGSVVALIGYESSPNWTLRGLLGPAYVRAEESTLGFQGRIDIAVPFVSRVSFALSARAMLIPDYRGDSFQLYAFGLGLRLR